MKEGDTDGVLFFTLLNNCAIIINIIFIAEFIRIKKGKNMPEKFRGDVGHEEKESSGKFEKLIKEGKIKEGDFVYRASYSLPSIISKIEEGKIEFLGLDDIGIHDDLDLTESNIGEISELEEDFKNGELRIMPESDIVQFIERGIEELKDRDYPVVKEKSVEENARIIKERREFYQQMAKLRGIKIENE